MIDWTKEHIVKINNEISYPESFEENEIKSWREKVEPWLTSIFQSEHFSVLLGSGFSAGINRIAEVESVGMVRLDFEAKKEKIKNWSDKSAKDYGRGEANFEDDLRTALELLQGLKILESKNIKELEDEINEKLYEFIEGILKVERGFIKSEKKDTAIKYLKSFLISFASRAASRERTNIFTTNYDRFIEYGLDSAGILTIDRFIGKIKPVLRTTKLDLDYHYNPPGIRGEPRYVEGVIRFTKIHGSIDWQFEDDQIIKIPLIFGSGEENELIPDNPKDFSVIYPNSAKGIEVAFYPYAELFRDFSTGICRPNSVIVTYGYGFGDTHINRILSDMLTIPSTHMAIISHGKVDGRIDAFVAKNNFAQFTLLIGNHFGDLQNLVDHYLPKAAIDRIQERMARNLEKRGKSFNKGETTDYE